jgi:hypothetical protein
MSRLYSSPEVTSVELPVLRYQPWIAVIVAWSDAARVTRTESQCSSIPDRFAVRRGQQSHAPNSPADGADCIKSFRLPKQAQVFRVIFQAQYQAFVRFAVRSSAALYSHRA